MSLDKACVQLAVKFHGDEVAILEAQIELPDFYQPAPGTWLQHAYLDGPNLVAAFGYDATRGRPVVTIGQGAQDASRTLEDFLEENPQWKVAKHPTINIMQIKDFLKKFKPPPCSGEHPEDDDDDDEGEEWKKGLPPNDDDPFSDN